MVTIAVYQPDYFDALTAYRLNEEQSQFSRIPAQVLTDAEIMSNTRRFHYCIVFDEQPVGFFSLDFSNDRLIYTSNIDAVLLRSFSVNPAFQGKGIAKTALLQLPAFVKQHFPATTEIVFGVNARNTSAYQLYLKTGYSDSGSIYEGIKGPQYVMFKKLEEI